LRREKDASSVTIHGSHAIGDGEVTRFEFDPRRERTRTLHSIYPSLPPLFYRRMRDRIHDLGR
jgi:hypothetical protein